MTFIPAPFDADKLDADIENLMREYPPLEVRLVVEKKTAIYDGVDLPRTRTQVDRPIERVVITTINSAGVATEHYVEGAAFGMGTLEHNVGTGEVSITFVDVQTLEVLYKDVARDGGSNG